MWKVVLVICALGNPCVIFEEDPKKYYHDKKECEIVAEAKHTEMISAFVDYGYWVESSTHGCENVPIQ